MAIDYTAASETYDNTRGSNPGLIELFEEEVRFDESTNVLDFGCGTGNYLLAIRDRFRSRCFGVEPSDGMIAKARAKNPDLTIRRGDHSSLPFDDDFFHFIYMTDVIHHVPDLDGLFGNLYVKLRKNGKVCILTESHAQVESRWYNAYFSSLASIEKKRYPDIPVIEASAGRNGFYRIKNRVKPEENDAVVTDVFIRAVEEKNYSMFRLLEEPEYRQGLARLKADRGRVIGRTGHGETLVWLGKP